LKLEYIFDGSENFPLGGIVSTIFRRAKKTTEEEFVEEHDYGVECGEYKDILGKGYLLYEGYFSDEGTSPTEAYLCDTDLNIAAEDFIMIHEGGY
jgi:hypothetical protein